MLINMFNMTKYFESLQNRQLCYGFEIRNCIELLHKWTNISISKNELYEFICKYVF